MNASLLVKPLDIEIHLNLDTAMVVKITSIGGQNYLTTALQKQLQSNRIHLYRTSVKSFVKIRYAFKKKKSRIMRHCPI